ncbi:MAG: ABC transporter ATP-binding protein [Candidatus Pelethousia sp.]|nr:ABC transporter ATP-binding protein [Candidatus Pelethousia sp.]
MGAEHIIHCQDIHKYYQVGEEQLEVLRGITLTVDQGEYLAVLGPSGSGKSTLMNIIGCMDDFQKGRYSLAGIPTETMNEEQLALLRNRLIGFIFQRYHLLPRYNVLQNVMMPLLVRGMSRQEAQRCSLEKLDMLGMSARLSHKPNALSGGQQQRVAIARALVGQPRLLLADEPTGALDSNTGKEVLKLFRQLHEMGHTIVIITHDLQVASHAARVVRIVDGELFEGHDQGA